MYVRWRQTTEKVFAAKRASSSYTRTAITTFAFGRQNIFARVMKHMGIN